METITEEYVQQKMQRVQAYKSKLRNFADRHRAFQNVLTDRYLQLRQSQSSTRDYIAESLNILHSVLKQPDLVEQTLLINYISEIIRFVENVGLGFEFGKEFVDRSIAVYRHADYPVAELYLTKAKFLRLNQLENKERELAFQAARMDAQHRGDIEGLVKVLLQLTEYYTEVSLYEDSLKTCQECEQLIRAEGRGQTYLPRVLTDFGMNYTPLFNYNLARSYFLQAKELLERESARDEQPNAYPGIRTMATVTHYLGRIAEAQGYLQDAMDYYVESERYQCMCPEELSATAFQHLRFGELLASAGLLQEAREHILISQKMFNEIQFSSSGSVLIGLAWASICSKEGNYKRAREYMRIAQQDARTNNFARGELLCSVKLFWLELRHFQIHHALHTFFQGMMTWRSGELRRNGGLRLLGKYLFQIGTTPFKRLSHVRYTTIGGASTNVALESCTCSMHRSAGSTASGGHHPTVRE